MKTNPSKLSTTIRTTGQKLGIMMFSRGRGPNKRLFGRVRGFFKSGRRGTGIENFIVKRRLLRRTTSTNIRIILGTAIVNVCLSGRVIMEVGSRIRRCGKSSVVVTAKTTRGVIAFRN